MKKCLTAIVLFSLVGLGSTAQAQYRCVEGDCVNGKGKKVLENGSGGLEGDFFEGTLVSGKAVFPNGDVFEGQFKNSQLVQGTKRFKNGRTLEGKFFDNIFIKGKITEPDGTEREIEMKDLNAPSPRVKASPPTPGK